MIQAVRSQAGIPDKELRMRDEETSREKDSPVSISIFIFYFLNIFEGKSTIKGHYHRNSCHTVKKRYRLKSEF